MLRAIELGQRLFAMGNESTNRYINPKTGIRVYAAPGELDKRNTTLVPLFESKLRKDKK